MIATALSLIAAAYLMGSAPFAVIISRFAGLPDPRHVGSGNVGATNVARSGNKTASVLTLLADGGKGVVALIAADALQMPPAVVAACGFAAVFGHVFSIFLRFSGGRGVATSLAVFLYWQPLLAAAALAVWALTFAVSRYSSLSSILAVTTAAVLFILYAAPPIAVAAVAVALLVIFRHRENIGRLWRGEENRFGRTKSGS